MALEEKVEVVRSRGESSELVRTTSKISHISSLERLHAKDGEIGFAEAASPGGGSAPWGSNFIPQELLAVRRESNVDIPAHIRQGVFYKISRHPTFRLFVNLSILLNAVQMGAAADLRASPWPSIWEVFDHIFTAAFATEMVVQLAALRRYYFSDPWNLLDGFVAMVAIVDTWILKNIGLPDEHLGVLRIFRLLRVLRLVKLMHVIPELLMVVEGIIASLKSMFWIFLLLLIVIYACGICCVEVIGQADSGFPAWDDRQEDINAGTVDKFNSYHYFGTVSRAMMSLFNIVLVSEWNEISRPVFEIHKMMTLFFIGLVILCSFGILNVIIGVVVERTTQAMNTMRECHLEKLKRKQVEEVSALAEIMFDLDEDHNQRLSREEFERGSGNPQLQTLIQGIEFPIGFTFDEMFTMLDTDGDGLLTRTEFVDGIMRLIYNSDFQRDCMQLCSFGLIKRSQRELHAELRELTMELRRDVQMLHQDIRVKFGEACAKGPQQEPESFGGSPNAELAPASSSTITLSASKISDSIGANGHENAQRRSNNITPDSNGLSCGVSSSWEPLQTSKMLLKLLMPPMHGVCIPSTTETPSTSTVDLQETSKMPVKLLTMHPQSSTSSVAESLDTEVVKLLEHIASRLASPRLVGFLPVMDFTGEYDEGGIPSTRDGPHLGVTGVSFNSKDLRTL